MDVAGAVVTVLTRPGCHLCEAVVPVVAGVCADLGLAWTEVSIVERPELVAAYAEMIPVTMIDGAVHDYWRIDPARLRDALSARP